MGYVIEEDIPQQMDLPEFYTGSPVDSSDLRYRDDFLDEVWEDLRTKHVLLTAPRRTGKTSIMDHLRDHSRNGFAVIKENVQDLAHPADFFTTLLARFHDEYPDLLRDGIAKGWGFVSDALTKTKEVGYGEFKVALRESDPRWRENWRDHGDKLLSQLRTFEDPTLIIVDELPDMILTLKWEDPHLLRDFLAWFRTQRMDPNPKHDPVRWLVGGSVNLSSTLDAVGMVDLINDMEDKPLPVLTSDQVKHFVVTMLEGRGVEFDVDLPGHVVDLIGQPIPIFMQMLTLDLYRIWKRQPSAKAPLTTQAADQDKLQHYHSRLARYYQEPMLSAAHSILGQLSLSGNGLSRSRLRQEFERHYADAGQSLLPHESRQQFNQLLRNLENDFYVAEIHEDTFDFASGVLKAWWKKYYA